HASDPLSASRAFSGGEEPPLLADAFELGRPAIAESKARAGDEVPDRARHENLSGLGLARHPRTAVHGDPTDLPVHHLALPRVQPGAYLEPELAHGLGDGAGAPNGTGRAVEPCEEAVPGHVELRTAKADELAADQRVVLLEQLSPGAISH